MRYLLIINPVSGPDANAIEMASRAVSLLLEQGHEVTCFVTREPDDAYHRALDPGDADVIVVMGGDGTVNEVGRALIGTDTVMGILPNGSGNGLARELHIPMDLEPAIEVLLRHEVQRIDTGRVNGKPFLCTCGIGLDAAVSEKFSASKTRGFISYIADTVDLFGQYHAEDYRLTIDGEESEVHAYVVSVANASQYGNNAFIAPDASLVDGMLDVTAIEEFPPGEAGLIAYRLFSGDLTESKYTRQLRGRQITIRTDKSVIYHIDGDAMEETHELRIEAVPRSLSVCSGRPEDRDKTIFDFLHTVRSNAQRISAGVADLFTPKQR